MEDNGIPEEQIYQMLRKYKEKDLTHRSGRILGSMCTCPHPVGIKAYMMFLESNLGDPGLFPGTKSLEEEAITMLGELMGKKEVYGHIITGGTEANLMAMRAARNISKVRDPEIIVPKSAHFSFKKAADMLKLDMKMADLDDDYRMDTSSVEDLISDNTVAIVGVAGTTELGKIDPIEELSRICLEKDIYLHVDAAFGGYSIPFLKDAGYDLPEFDFSLPGVSSITIDPHKMGLAPIPTGGILFREREYLEVMAIETPYLTEDLQSTVVGTRTGAATAATWALLKHLGREGYQEVSRKCMEITSHLAEGVEKAGFELVTRPELNIVAFRSSQIPVEEIASKLENRGWAVSLASYPQAIRIIVMPHLKREHVKAFLADLELIKED
ncbi:tyrosine decarboxylase MfnA [Methanobacterium petrolearium]|uniref:tyrosine decarboxylase MfnA n=1 Tax=Methanobacterium petrolearium TaxID=710190 RepID=UPI001AE221F6|nr:tyrosine decarboxylase MfnA [Methanobacterium petrolearium]MBP1945828.1 tyrosine decarboxylase/aspartate 1-decarboxylase [Methanobacterium petrolearium]BDZ69622.1 tyrosine decarboxylase MfnA [Methanobacterium petrolearium]